ncbi:MAG TPA: DUF4403 family protein, partial [Gemmatimonadaceae bacterium]
MLRSFRISLSTAGALFTLLIAACEARLDVDAPPPAMMADTDTLPSLPTSTLDIPLTLDLSPVVGALDKAVPTKFGNIDEQKQTSNKRVKIAYEATRDPFAVSLNGTTATISGVVHYKGRGWYNPRIGPDVSSSCGISDAQPRAKIVISSKLEITPEWRLKGKSRIADVEPYSSERRDQCRVTFLKIDVTDRVISATREALEKQRPMI